MHLCQMYLGIQRHTYITGNNLIPSNLAISYTPKVITPTELADTNVHCKGMDIVFVCGVGVSAFLDTFTAHVVKWHRCALLCIPVLELVSCTQSFFEFFIFLSPLFFTCFQQIIREHGHM